MASWTIHAFFHRPTCAASLITPFPQFRNAPLSIFAESKVHNPGLTVLGGLPLALGPRSDRPLRISAKEEMIYQEYAVALAQHSIPLFKTVMYLSAKHSVEEARINADLRLMHWTAQRRYRRFFAEVIARIQALSLPSIPSHARRTNVHGAAATARKA